MFFTVKLASGSRSLTTPSSRRRLHRRRDDRGVNQRAAFDDQTSRVELTVDLARSFSDRPSFSMRWRKRQIEEWSGVS